MRKKLSSIATLATVLVVMVVISAMVSSTILASMMIMEHWFMIPQWYNDTAWYALINAAVVFVGGIVGWIICAVMLIIIRKTRAIRKAHR